MIRVASSVLIGRPADIVFAYVADQTNAPRWQRGLLEVRRTTEGPIGVGTRHTGARMFMGRRLELSNEYTRYEPDRLVEFSISGSMPGHSGYLVESTSPGRTRLSVSMEMRAPGPLRLAEPLIAATLRRDVEANLGTLKGLLEAEAEATRRSVGGIVPD